MLGKFADGGVKSVESPDILKVDPLTTFGTSTEIVKLFGGKEKCLAAIYELEKTLQGSSLIQACGYGSFFLTMANLPQLESGVEFTS